MNTKKFEESFLELVDDDVEAALQLITGMFVGLTVEYTKIRGHDPSVDLFIDGCGNRNITIHAVISNSMTGAA